MQHSGKFLFALLFVLQACSQHQKIERIPAQAFDEVRDSEGNVRANYDGIYQVYERMTPSQRVRLRNQFHRQDFQGDNALLPLPRVIDANEYEQTLRPGVEQRGRALTEFLKDILSGRFEIAEAGIIPKEFIEALLRQYNAEEWAKVLRPEDLSFWYGPDLVRSADGQFRVLEDNIGNLGGIGDLVTAQESLFERIPGYKQQGDFNDPEKFYNEMIDRYQTRAQKHGGIVAMVQYTKNLYSDNENLRVRKLFEDRGVEIVKVNLWNPYDKRLSRKLDVTKDGVFLENSQGKKVKVGFVAVGVEASDLDSSHPAFKKRRIVNEARVQMENPNLSTEHRKNLESIVERVYDGDSSALNELDRYIRTQLNLPHSLDGNFGIPNLWRAQSANKVAIGGVPLFDDLLGDKALYRFAEDMIRFYLKEEPILKNIPTQAFLKVAKKGAVKTLDESLIKEVFSSFHRYVLKRVDGRGGDAVWVGPKVKAKKLAELEALVRSEPEKFIVQEFLELSQMEGHLVDVRLHSLIENNFELVSEVPWGRAVPLSGDGKVNISASGSETTVLVRKVFSNCAQSMRVFLKALR